MKLKIEKLLKQKGIEYELIKLSRERFVPFCSKYRFCWTKKSLLSRKSIAAPATICTV